MKTYYNDAKETFNTEITALEKVRDELNESFDQVVDAVLATRTLNFYCYWKIRDYC